MKNPAPSIVLVRQRPAFGDALLLSALIPRIKGVHPDHPLTVITDSNYSAGAMVDIFQGIPYIDKVISIPSHEWTTDSNRRVDGGVAPESARTPLQIAKALKVYDCNGAFIEYERQHRGNPPLGIAQFWLNHFGFPYHGPNTHLPEFIVNHKQKLEAETWLESRGVIGSRYICLVLRAGDPVRDWDYNGISYQLIDYFYTKGIKVVTIDPIAKLEDPRAIPAIGLRLPIVAEILKRSMFTISPDTGILHLAEAVGNPTIAVWGIMPPQLRVLDYNTVLCPNPPLGICDQGDTCHCWQFQRWSCLRRIKLNHLVNAIEERLQTL